MMSHRKKGHLAATDEYAKHLRPDGKREFWGQHRQAEKKACDTNDDGSNDPPKPKRKKRRCDTHKWGVRMWYGYTLWYDAEKKRDQAYEMFCKNIPIFSGQRAWALPRKVNRL